MSVRAGTPDTELRVGIMGGMFDPVHAGHLQLAAQVRDLCELDLVRLVPCGNPVHRAYAAVSCAQRVDMLELAVENRRWLEVDARECLDEAPSWTFNTVKAINAELPQAQLFLLMGLDAFLALATWHRWRDLFRLVNIVVVTRPGYAWNAATADADLAAEVEARITMDPGAFRASRCGRILLASLAMPAISSSQIRDMVRTGENTAEKLHPAVAGYIKANALYQS